QQYMPIIQQNLKAVGINATLFPMDSTTFIARSTTPADFGSWEGAMENGGDEALNPANSAAYYDCKANSEVGYTNCQVDSLFAQAGSTADPAQQNNLYNQVGKILNAQLPSAYLWSPNLLSAGTTKLGGGFAVRINTKYTFFNVTTWTLSGSA